MVPLCKRRSRIASFEAATMTGHPQPKVKVTKVRILKSDDFLERLGRPMFGIKSIPYCRACFLHLALYLLVQLTDWMVNVAGFIGGIIFLGLAGLLRFGIGQFLR